VTVYTIDPLRDPRWPELLDRHASASVFHSAPWLEAIRQTYGYTPVVYTTSSPSSPLSNGIAFCQIKSWLTGRRMVSLPFSDHCEPLLDGLESQEAITRELKDAANAGKWKYVELRPRSDQTAIEGVTATPACFLHTLDLTPTPEDILRRTHKTSVQQSIKRAEREGIECEIGNSERLLQAFYRLLLLTRRKHQLPPQPIDWFRNLAVCMGDRLQIRVAFHKGEAIAAIVTLLHKDTIVYKYGCSNAQFSNLGGTQLLLWKAIVDAKAAGMTCMDFGRSDADNEGLIKFKDRWGATPSQLVYVRWSRKPAAEGARHASAGILKRLFAMMPDVVLETTGRILYRHVG
jgi:CelD/BcsL family acetyltransferase involved in cellulose biosynthesis